MRLFLVRSWLCSLLARHAWHAWERGWGMAGVMGCFDLTIRQLDLQLPVGPWRPNQCAARAT